jgi:hypothetical protein
MIRRVFSLQFLHKAFLPREITFNEHSTSNISNMNKLGAFGFRPKPGDRLEPQQ